MRIARASPIICSKAAATSADATMVRSPVMARTYPAMSSPRRVGIMTVLLLFVVGCASSHPTVASTSTVRANTTISVGAATQTTSRGSAIADLLLSSCVLHRSRAQVRSELTKIVAADKVELFLQQYDAMAC